MVVDLSCSQQFIRLAAFPSRAFKQIANPVPKQLLAVCERPQCKFNWASSIVRWPIKGLPLDMYNP
jgi:hypothetical protein